MSPLGSLWLRRAQDHLVGLLGNSAEGRTPLVAGMLHRDASEAASYWLQLVVSVGIATLGLVLGSTAVVIGAMLVAPLMRPIVGLAMGLAAGSPFLVLRSAGRIGLSMLVAVGGAAAITVLLPYHELNAEISARTSPTVLDLITAAFCALAGVFASLRPGSDTVATAAGTSISISLIPPLCASGYGVGTASSSVAGGAALLFLTNLVAIVVVGTVSFVAAGFNRVGVLTLEREEFSQAGKGAPIARSLARRLARLFESRWGSVLRFLMPLLMLAAVYVPLRRALDEVVWEVRVRAEAHKLLSQATPRVIQSKLSIERHEVEVVVVLVGGASDAELLRSRLNTRIRHASGVTPRIEVMAVPDATAFAGLESTLLKPRTAPAPTSLLSPREQLDMARTRVREAVDKVWPREASGQPLLVNVSAVPAEPMQVRIVHLGATLTPDAAETVRRALTIELDHAPQIVDIAVPAQELNREAGDLPFVAAVSSAVRASAEVEEISVCVSRPDAVNKTGAAHDTQAELARALDVALASHPRVTTITGKWSVRLVVGACHAAETDAGAPEIDDAGSNDGSAP